MLPEGNDNLIVKYRISGDHQLEESDQIKLGEKWPVKISPAGIQVNDKSNMLYVVTKENNSLYIVDLISKKSHSIPSWRRSLYMSAFKK